MSKVVSFQCDRCRALMLLEFTTIMTLRKDKDSTSVRHFCDKCMEHIYFEIQSLNE